VKTENILIANLKCSGCANTITSKLLELNGMESVVVDQDTDTVSVRYSTPLLRSGITEKLLSLGYPEATAENGLLTQLKSYASCMIGRIHS
jgi:copper chaperone CopZ